MAITNNKDINKLILQKLDWEDILSAQLINKRSREILQDETFWHNKFNRDFKDLTIKQQHSEENIIESLAHKYKENYLTLNDKISWKKCYYHFRREVNKLNTYEDIRKYKTTKIRTEISNLIVGISCHLYNISIRDNYNEHFSEIKTLLRNPFIRYSDNYFEMLPVELWQYILKYESELPFAIPKHILILRAYYKKDAKMLDLSSIVYEQIENKKAFWNDILEYLKQSSYGGTVIKDLIQANILPVEYMILDERFIMNYYEDKIDQIFKRNKFSAKVIGDSILSNNDYSQQYISRLVELYISITGIEEILNLLIERSEHSYLSREIGTIHDYILQNYNTKGYQEENEKILRFRMNNVRLTDLETHSILPLSSMLNKLENDCSY